MATLEIGSIAMQLHRKAIKHLHISVLPPDGRVRVSAPEGMTDTAIRMALVNRLVWIKKQQRAFAQQPRQSKREMVSGECHYLWGRAHRLKVVERVGRHGVSASSGHLYLYINPKTTADNKRGLLQSFYRAELKARLAHLLPYWEKKIGVAVAAWGVKKMKTRWGSCTVQARRIWLNLELAKKPPECLEYVLVHELVHLLERHHNARFKRYMDTFIPNWPERSALLNQMPLAHDDWIN